MNFDVSNPIVLSGVLFGAMLPYLSAALTMTRVGKTATEIIVAVRRLFRELFLWGIPHITLKSYIERASRGEIPPPDEVVIPYYYRCVTILTRTPRRT